MTPPPAPFPRLPRRFRTAEEARRFLTLATDYERMARVRYTRTTFDLRRMEALCAALGHPERSFRSIHIAGTKGKGSTAAMIAGMLKAAGLRVGLYLSPHVVDFSERIQVSGRPIGSGSFRWAANRLLPGLRRLRRAGLAFPTFFECVTALAFEHFRRARADVAVLETGLGGRLDATNVVRPEVAVITPIEYDHQHQLGRTLGRIAGEKGGIIKPGVPVVLARQRPVAERILLRLARARGAPVVRAGRLIGLDRMRLCRTSAGPRLAVRALLRDTPGSTARFRLRLVGRHQLENLRTALAALVTYHRRTGTPIPGPAVERGAGEAFLPGRFQCLASDPPIVVDGCHNPVSCRAFVDTYRAVFGRRPVTLVFGCAADKPAAAMIRILSGLRPDWIFTTTGSPRAADPAVLRRAAGRGRAVSEPAAAVRLGRRESRRSGRILAVAGSLYLAGIALRTLSGRTHPGIDSPAPRC